MDALPAGTLLQNGAFTVERLLASSNFSFTYFARDQTLRRAVALKEFFPLGCRRAGGAAGVLPPKSPTAVSFAAAREKFLKEARVLAGFHHPGIVAVHTFFEENNTAYMAMEFLNGQTLGQQLAARHPFSEGEAVQIAQDVGATLEAVHRGGFLHCDLTPDNIFRCEDERLVLLDFGLSTRLDTSNYGTRSLDDGLRFGTPGYAPLEQYATIGVLSASTDVYALAATIYHLLTGQAPPSATDRAYGVALPAPREMNPKLSTHINGALLWALQMTPALRPASARELVLHLRRRDEYENARARLVGVLRARAQQLQARKPPANQAVEPVSLEHAPLSPVPIRATIPLQQPQDDSGCLQFTFMTALILWLFAAMICMAWLFVRFIQVRW